VPYEIRAHEAQEYAKKYSINPTRGDNPNICLVLVDVQNTFCLPDFELFVAGRSGSGAVDDNIRLCEFIYRNLGSITQIVPSLDTHTPQQIFHASFFINDAGEHPQPMTMITADDILDGRWKFNSALAGPLRISPEFGQEHLLYYTRTLESRGKYTLTIWPYHAMIGGIGHALVSSVEEAIFFHSIARHTQPDFIVKGTRPFTEHYSIIGPEVAFDKFGNPLGKKDNILLEKVQKYDAVIIAGQAKSHCVAWTVNDLFDEIQETNPKLIRKIYLMEDCTSAVVVPGAVDFTDTADQTFSRFEEAGMHLVRSTQALQEMLVLPNL